MSSGDFNLLHLRNLKMYKPDGSFPTVSSIFTIGTDGVPVYTSDIAVRGLSASTLTASTVNAGSVGFSSMAGSSITASTATVSSLGVTSLLGVSSLLASTVSTNLLTTSDVQLQSSVIALGLSTTSTQANFSGGSYSAGSWVSAKSGVATARKLAMSSNGQYQVVVSGATADLWMSSDSGATWSSLGASQGLPVLTGSAYWSSGSISASGQHILLGVYGGSLWISSDYGRTFALTEQPTPDIWLQLNGSATDTMGASTVTAFGSPSYAPVQRPGYSAQAIQLANTAGGTATRYVRGSWSGSPSGNFTVSGWVNPQTLNSTYQGIFSAYDGRLAVSISDSNTLYASIPHGGGTNFTSLGFYSLTVSTNTWYYFTLIFQSNGLCSFYVNNTLLGSITNTGGVGSLVATQISLGTYDNATNLAFNGLIADLKIHNSAVPYTPIPLLAPNIWLPFENSVADLGSNAIVPTVTGSVSYVPGVIGLNAVNLVNTAGGTADNRLSGAWSGSVNWTASLWVNSQTLNGTTQVFFGSYNTGIVLGINTSNRIFYQIPTGGAGGVATLTTSTTISTNTWYSILITFQTNSTCLLYVNGSLIGTTTNSGGYGGYPSMGIFMLGTYDAFSTANAFNGYIDDFRLYNAAIPYHALVPQNYKSVALAGTGQYALAAAASGWVVGSTDSMKTWSKQSVCVGTQGDVIQPNKSGLAQAQWEKDGVNYVASASSINGSLFPYLGFNNLTTMNNGWASTGGTYSDVNGSYIGSVSTTVLGGVGAQLGEWLQIQTSIPVVLSSYTFSIVDAVTRIPKVFYIVGSMDGATWHPLQYASMATNPFTVAYSTAINSLVISTSGSQTLTAGASATVTTISYPTSTTPYMYFRIIINSVFPSSNGLTQIGELYLNFAKSSPTSLALSHSGQYQMVATGSASGSVMPNQSGLASSTWVQGGVTWGATVSSQIDSGHPPYKLFENNFSMAAINRWASLAGVYNTSTGIYTGTLSTVIQGVGTISGEWVQIQSSVPIVLSSYAYAAGAQLLNLPKVYYIVGSMDGSTWFPLQLADMVTTPFTAGGTLCTYIQVNQTGTQTPSAGQTGSITTTSYATSAQPYMYFRVVITTIRTTNGSLSEIGELYLNFSNSLSYSSNYGTTWFNQSNVVSNEIVALSPSGQVALSTNCVAPLARLTMDNTNVDSQGVLVPATGAGTVTYSSAIRKVGATSAFFNNTAGAAPSVYVRYTTPSTIYTPSALTMSLWVYPTSYPSSNLSIPFAFNNGGSDSSNQFYINSSGNVRYSGLTTSGVGGDIGSTTISLNTWTHLATTFIAGTFIFYVNGVVSGSLTASGNMCIHLGANMSHVFIGANTTGFNAFAGYIDDVRLYTSALSAHEVASLYSNPALTQSVGVSSSYLPITSYVKPVLPGATANVVDAKVSQTGQYMVAVTSGSVNNVFYSTDSGATFSAVTVGASPLTACTMSADGSYLTVSNVLGAVYTLNKNSVGYTVAVGSSAGAVNQGANSIAIGNGAGAVNQSANSIVLNASGSALGTGASGFYVSPIGTTAGLPMDLLGYGSDSQVVKTGVVVLPGGVLLAPRNVGIRTTEPRASLDVDGDIITQWFGGGIDRRIGTQFNAATSGYYLGLITNTGNRALNLVSQSSDPGGSGAVLISTGAGPTERMRIDASGNVGIGTNPTYLLDINGPSRNLGNCVRIKATWPTINLDGTDGSGGRLWGIMNTDNSAGAGGGKFAIYDYTGNGYRMVIDTVGNVGIGITNPGAKLQVNGPYNGTASTSQFTISNSSNTNGQTLFAVESNGNCYITPIEQSVSSSRTFGPGLDNVTFLGNSSFRWTQVWAANGTIQTSDSKEKDSQPLPYGINEILQVRTIKYKWKSQADLPDDDPAKNFQYYGFCADELGPLFPELVYDENKSAPVQMNYAEILPVVVNALKEEHASVVALKATVESQSEKILALESQLADKSAKLDALLSWAQAQGFSPSA